MARTTRVGRYDNPYAVAEWDRPLPAGTTCEPLILETADRAIANGWLYARRGETTAVLLVHPRADISHPPAAAARVYLAAHVGEGFYLLHAIDASVTDERDPVSCDPALDLYDLANGFVEPPGETRYEPEFVKRYRNGQRARVERLDTLARERVARRREARARWEQSGSVVDRRRSIATDFLTVYRTDADPRFVDLSLDPSRRTVGSLWGARPDWIHYGAVGFGRIVSPEAWLSTWSGSPSRASSESTGPGLTLPAPVGSYSGDHGIFPSDTDIIATSLAAPRVDRVEIDSDHYGLPAGRDEAVLAIADWIGATA